MWGRAALHDLAVGAQLDAQHAVGGRVLRPHVEDHLVGVEIGRRLAPVAQRAVLAR